MTENANLATADEIIAEMISPIRVARDTEFEELISAAHDADRAAVSVAQTAYVQAVFDGVSSHLDNDEAHDLFGVDEWGKDTDTMENLACLLARSITTPEELQRCIAHLEQFARRSLRFYLTYEGIDDLAQQVPA